MGPGRSGSFIINIPRSVFVGLGSGILLLIVFALAGSLDPLALAAVFSYLVIYGFSLVLLRPPTARRPDPPQVGTDRLRGEDQSPG